MPKGVLVVRTTPTEGREPDYNAWYDDVHLADILKLAGFTSARRFRTLEGDSFPYLALYEVEADDLKAAQAAIGEGVASGAIPISDALGMSPAPTMAMYEQITELHS
jgi:hypothetical protein